MATDDREAMVERAGAVFAAVTRVLARSLDAFAGLADGAPDRDRLARFHEDCLALTWAALRDACTATGVRYPEHVEQEFRDYYARELGVVVPPLA